MQDDVTEDALNERSMGKKIFSSFSSKNGLPCEEDFALIHWCCSEVILSWGLMNGHGDDAGDLHRVGVPDRPRQSLEDPRL